jgi:hypothetical protein
MESSTIENHQRLRELAEAELETNRNLNPGVSREAVRLEVVSHFAQLAQRYANGGSAKMSQAMAVAAAHLGMPSRDREHVPVASPVSLIHRVA